MPPILLWTVGVVGAIALAKFIRREYRRVNDELDQARMATVASKAERAQHPTLKRDPRTGIYHP
ncbi:MAG: hypothetical protein RO009_05205 [Pseudorhodoplanes sp.]|jgi:hypothetical protein|nr:hypothetical protein [Pseudorhodoplanes sp.]